MTDTRPTRRTQEARSAATRGKILDATLECLVEHGYSGTSTPEVCRRAGVSRGALLHHFPTKAELVTRAVSHLAERRGEELRARRERTPAGAGRDSLDAILETLWAAFFTGPFFFAALELWTAARCDRELHAALLPIEEAVGRAIRKSQATAMQPLVGEDPALSQKLDDVVALTIHLLRGMALQKLLKDDDKNRRRLFEVWKRMVEATLRSA